MDRVVLGRTGIEVSRLAIGTGTNGVNHQSAQSRLGIHGLVRLLLFAKEQGVTFWDAADDYGTHPHVREALQQVPRHEVVITTKSFARDPETMEKHVHRFLEELGTDYIDILLLHCLTDEHWPKKMRPVMDVLSRHKAQGIIRAVGVSCHDLGALRATAGEEWVEVALVRINYEGLHMDGPPDEVEPVLQALHSAGKGIYGMKVYGLGKLEDRAKALNYVFSLGTVSAVVIGMRSEQEVEENVRLVEQAIGS